MEPDVGGGDHVRDLDDAKVDHVLDPDDTRANHVCSRMMPLLIPNGARPLEFRSRVDPYDTSADHINNYDNNS